MILVFDIGATQSRFGLSQDGRRLAETIAFPTPEKFADGLLLFRNVQKQWQLGDKLQAVAGGVPGPLSKAKTGLLNAPHLQDWNHKPLKQQLQRIFKVPIHLANDTALVGLGEAAQGAGKGHAIVAYITISTGVNGVQIVDGKIDRSALGFEIGHQILSVEKPTYRTYTWEDFVSGAALMRLYGQRPEEIGDEKVWQAVERYIAYGLNNVIVHWSPDVVVLGGGIMRSKHISLERIKGHLNKVLKIFSVLPAVVAARLGDQGGLYGALVYLKKEVTLRRANAHDIKES